MLMQGVDTGVRVEKEASMIEVNFLGVGGMHMI